MKRQSRKHSKLERDNRAWRRQLTLDVGRCQLPDCPGSFPRDLSVHEIARGSSRQAAYSERLACLVVCGHCNCHRLTDYAMWPIERQAALQCLLVADFATPKEVLETICAVRGRPPSAITWQDVAPYLSLTL